MVSRSALVALVAVSSLLGLVGCANPCLDLAKKVCNCNVDSYEASTCVTNAEAQSSNTHTSSSQDDRCDALLKTCDCAKLQTPEGSAACGLANTPQ